MNSLVKSVAGTRVFVGLSGGVDSAVTAALLTEAGADVTGVFIKGWYPPGMPCTWAADRRDAMRVAAHLHIPFVTLDASKAYKEGVIDYLLREYKAGRTPNPDIMCNREVKFGAFFAYAKEQGADFIATGHYARVENGMLSRGVDPAKDQSYFLWAIPREALAHTLFPLGSMRKEETRAVAHARKLPVAEKRDSQGICFLGSVSVDDFLRSEFGTKEGSVQREDGSELGKHDGALLYTLGQRLTETLTESGPWYVVRKDIERNVLTVAHARTGNQETSVRLYETNWFSDTTPHGSVVAQYRYHGPQVHGTLSADGSVFIPNEKFPEALASGQSLVIYTGDVCIGGGIMR